MLNHKFVIMSKDPFKTRLEIAKKKLIKRNLNNEKRNTSSIGTAFKLSTELESTAGWGWIVLFINCISL